MRNVVRADAGHEQSAPARAPLVFPSGSLIGLGITWIISYPVLSVDTSSGCVALSFLRSTLPIHFSVPFLFRLIVSDDPRDDVVTRYSFLNSVLSFNLRLPLSSCYDGPARMYAAILEQRRAYFYQS